MRCGWEDRGSRDVIVTSTTGERFDAKIVGFSRDGQDVRVLYWFQLGDRVFLDRIQHRLARREKLWGEKEWPPLMKFMLETSDDGTGTADESLIDMARQIYGDFFEPTSTTHTPVQPAGLRDMALPLSIHPPTSRLDAAS